MAALETFKGWFKDLSQEEKKQIFEYVYGTTLMRKGFYAGPYPLIEETRGIYTGPLPASSSSSSCPTCGRAY